MSFQIVDAANAKSDDPIWNAYKEPPGDALPSCNGSKSSLLFSSGYNNNKASHLYCAQKM